MHPSHLGPAAHPATPTPRPGQGEPARDAEPGLASVTPLPDTGDLKRVQLVRKAVLAAAILAFLTVAAVTRPLLGEHALSSLLPGLGAVAIFAAILGRGWCSLYIGGRKTRELVDRGPYSISRNPLYVFSFLAAFGVGAQTGSLILAATAVVLAVVVFRETVRREETWLLSAFGDAYAAYRVRTPRFWPRWSAWRDEPLLEIRPARFVTTLLDGAFMLVAIPAMAGLDHARAAGLIPTWLVLL